jgi:hypothetical protein
MPNPHGNPQNLKHFQGKWNHGKTRTIRVPAALAEDVLQYARQLDEDNHVTQVNNVREAKNILEGALSMRANRGGAIKEQIRKALALL